MTETKPPPLYEIATTFLKLGSTAFGGPAAHIAMMEENLVRRKKWLSHEEFLDLIGATNLIPGPNSTEMAIHIGYKMGGWRGLFLGGICFIFPAFLIVWLLAWSYVKFSSLPQFQFLFLSIKPVILAVIAQAIWSLSKNAIKDKILFGLCAISIFLYGRGINELIILAAIAITNLFLRQKPPGAGKISLWFLAMPMFLIGLPSWASLNENHRIPVENVFVYFTKVGSVLFGSGYVLIAFLKNDLVDQYQWLNQQQLLDAIAVGQFTPGPVFTTATFIGYLISGHGGAIAATCGIFAPAFFFVAITAPLISRLRKSKWTSPLLDGLNVASLSLMMGAGILLAPESLQSIYEIIIFLLSLWLLIGYKVNSAWLILAAGILGFLKMNLGWV
ncbi:MAG TPA: chromate efflux transporter [Pseudobdellovibrionaceae bacterium]|jgi:chromate transporter